MENLSNISVIRDVLTHRLSAHGRIGKCAAGLGND